MTGPRVCFLHYGTNTMKPSLHFSCWYVTATRQSRGIWIDNDTKCCQSRRLEQRRERRTAQEHFVAATRKAGEHAPTSIRQRNQALSYRWKSDLQLLPGAERRHHILTWSALALQSSGASRLSASRMLLEPMLSPLQSASAFRTRIYSPTHFAASI